MIQLHIYIYFQIIFNYRLLKDINYSSLCYTANPVAYFLNWQEHWEDITIQCQLVNLEKKNDTNNGVSGGKEEFGFN